jgi:ribosomal protein L40E
MLKQKRENRIVNCLVCWTCHGRMGPNHFTLGDGDAVCELCQARNPLGNLRKMSIQEVTEPSEIIVCFTRAVRLLMLHLDCKTALSPWTRFASAETLEKAMRYLGATDAQMEDHRQSMRAWGQGSTHIRLLPNRKNLLCIDWDKL